MLFVVVVVVVNWRHPWKWNLPCPWWVTSLINRLSDDFSKHVYILSSRSSLAYPEPEGYQVPAVITSTVLCLSPLLNCCCFLFCFPLQTHLYAVAWHPSGHSRLHVKSKAWHHFHIFCPFSSLLVWSHCNHSFCTCKKVIPLSGVKKKNPRSPSVQKK